MMATVLGTNVHDGNGLRDSFIVKFSLLDTYMSINENFTINENFFNSENFTINVILRKYLCSLVKFPKHL
jgi:hypothetical protein